MACPAARAPQPDCSAISGTLPCTILAACQRPAWPRGKRTHPVPARRLGNAFTLWLGIDPPEIFFYAFLPPLLLDSALSIDYFLFHKVGRRRGAGASQQMECTAMQRQLRGALDAPLF
jgi:hypothetical protein